MNRPIDEQTLQYEALIQNIPGAVYRFYRNHDGVMGFEFISSFISTIMETERFSIDDFSKNFISYIHPEEQEILMHAIDNSYIHLKPFLWIGRIYSEKKNLKWVRITSKPRRRENKTVIWDGIILDITREKQIEEALKHNQNQSMITSRFYSIAEFAGTIAHEINTPLATILLCAEQIIGAIPKESTINSDPAVLKNADRIIEVVKHTIRIIKSVKALTRQTENEPRQTISLKNLLSSILELCQEKIIFARVQVDEKFKTKPDVMLECIEVQLSQVILNLVNNAVDILKKHPGAKKIMVDFLEDPEQVTLMIEDSGPGVPDEYVGQLFKKGFSLKPPSEGTGFGLSICKLIIEEHRGTISYNRIAGTTQFLIKLPKKN